MATVARASRPARDAATSTHASGISRRYAAIVRGDGAVLPIIESLGRRHLREIDPLGAEGRRLLATGRVTLWYEDGARVATRPIAGVLDEMEAAAMAKRKVHPHDAGWTAHYERLASLIGAMKRRLRAGA